MAMIIECLMLEVQVEKNCNTVAHGRRQRGTCPPPLDFHTWYFSVFFCYFLVFFPLDSPWKRLNSAIFRSSFPLAPPGNFSADAFAVAA